MSRSRLKVVFLKYLELLTGKYLVPFFSVILVIISAFLVFYQLGFPKINIFDEAYFIPAAQKYQNQTFFLENHPPLGKLIIALGDVVYDGKNRNSDFIGVEKIDSEWPVEKSITGYRLFPALISLFIPLLLFRVIRLIGLDSVSAFLISLLALFDTAMVMQERIAMLDGMLIFFILLSVIIFLKLVNQNDGYSSTTTILLFATFCGLSFNIKETGLVTLYLAFVFFFINRNQKIKKTIKNALLFLGVFLILYLGIQHIHFSLGKNIIDENVYGINPQDQEVLLSNQSKVNIFLKLFTEVKSSIKFSIDYNKGVPALKLGNPEEIGSPWYFWLLGGDSINYRWMSPDGKNFFISSLLGNPVTWVFSFLGVLIGSSIVISDLLFKFLEWTKLKQYLYIFVGFYWAYIIPFWLIRRVMYLYHYLPAMVIGVIIMAIVIGMSGKPTKMLWIILALLAIAAIALFLFLKSFVYYDSVTEQLFNVKNFWPFWNMQWVVKN